MQQLKAVMMLFLAAGVFQSCAYQLGSHTSNGFPAFSISDDAVRVILRKERYRHEKSLSAAMVGELSPATWIETKFLEIGYNINNISDEADLSEVLVITDFKGRTTPFRVFPVRGSSLLFYLDVDGRTGIATCKIVTQDGKLVKSIKGDEKMFGKFSPDNTMIYYYKSGLVHRFNVLQMSEETLPKTAYEFLRKGDFAKKPFHYAFPTRIDNIFLCRLKKRYQLVDITSGKIIKKFPQRDDERIREVALTADDILVLSEPYEGFGLVIRRSNGDMIDKIDLKKYFVQKEWDPENNRVCFLRKEEERLGRHYSKIKFKGLLWDYKNKTVKEFTLKCPVH